MSVISIRKTANTGAFYSVGQRTRSQGIFTTEIVKKPPGPEKTRKEEDFKSDNENKPDDEKTTVSASFEQYKQ